MKILVDDQLSGTLAEVREAVELRDHEGRVYGYFQPVGATTGLQAGHTPSPISDEELARRQATPGGRPLAEIWKDLANR